MFLPPQTSPLLLPLTCHVDCAPEAMSQNESSFPKLWLLRILLEQLYARLVYSFQYGTEALTTRAAARVSAALEGGGGGG